MLNKKKAIIPEVEKGKDHQIPPKGMTLVTEAPVATPETKEITDIGAATTLIPMRGLDIGAQVTILAMAKDHVIKAPTTAHAATSV